MSRQLLLDSLLCNIDKSDIYQKIMADDVVTDSEIAELSMRIGGLMSELENKLSSEQLALTTELLTNLAVLHVVSNLNKRSR